jgi:hypothetical protein
MAEPEDPLVRKLSGPWAQESCGECLLPLSYARMYAEHTRRQR